MLAVLGREERLEGPIPDLGGHPDAVVGDRQARVAPRFERGDVVGPDGDGDGCDVDPSAADDRVAGVEEEVHEELLDLPAVRVDPDRLGGRGGGDRDAVAERPPEQVDDLADEHGEIERLRAAGLAAAEEQELTGEVRGLVRRASDRGDVVGDLAVGPQALRDERRVVRDDAEQVVEVVGDAAREPAEALEATGVRELGLESVALELRFPLVAFELGFAQGGLRGEPLALVAHDPEPHRPAVVLDRAPRDGDGEGRAVTPLVPAERDEERLAGYQLGEGRARAFRFGAEVHDGHPEQLGPRVAVGTFGSLVRVEEPQVRGIEEEDGVGGVVEEQPETRVGGAERGLGEPFGRDVSERHHDPGRRVGPALEQRPGVDGEPDREPSPREISMTTFATGSPVRSATTAGWSSPGTREPSSAVPHQLLSKEVAPRRSSGAMRRIRDAAGLARTIRCSRSWKTTPSSSASNSARERTRTIRGSRPPS